MDQGEIRIARQGAVAILTLDNPGRLNALSVSMRRDLAVNIPALVRDADVRAIVITGAGDGFCAGGDFRGPRTAGPVSVRNALTLAHGWLRELVYGDTPVVTAINGAAAGAGLGLALLGDMILASERAVFRTGFIGVGVSPDYGLGWTLPRAIGAVRARDMLLSNRKVLAPEALAMGLVTRIHSEADLMPQALSLATQLAEAPFATALAKSLTASAFEMNFDAYLEKEALSQGLAFASEDYAEGARAFREKRHPAFRGL